MKNIDMSTLSPEVAAYIRSLEETVLEQKMELVKLQSLTEQLVNLHKKMYGQSSEKIQYVSGEHWNGCTVLWSDRRRRYSDRSCIPYIHHGSSCYISRAGIRDISRSCRIHHRHTSTTRVHSSWSAGGNGGVDFPSLLMA